MLSPYRRVLALPGTALMSATGVAARLPMSMMTLGVVVAVSSVYGSYALAGQVSAAYVIAGAVAAIPQGRLSDRFGQRPVLLVDAVVFGLAVGLLVHAVTSHQPAPWPHLWAALGGAAQPQVGAMIRARWSHLVPGDRDRHTAFALESVGDEVVFVTGPALVTFLSTAHSPQTGLVVALVVGALGPALLALQVRTQPPVDRTPQPRGTGRMPWSVLLTLTGAGAALGSLFGALEVATVAFATDAGHRPLSGLLLAVLAVASLLAGVVTGARAPVLPLRLRIRLGLGALTLCLTLPTFLGPLWLLGVVMFFAGLGIAPTLIAMISLLERAAPRRRLTEAMAWVQTGISAGIAPGSWLAGVVADHSSGATAFWVCVCSGAVALLVAAAIPGPAEPAATPRRTLTA